MKARQSLLVAGVLVAVLSGCVHNDASKSAIAETYIHKYGLAVEKSDWEQRGKNGKIVSTRKDGVRVEQNYKDGALVGDSTFTFPNSDVIARIETYDAGTLIAAQDNYPSGNAASMRQYMLGGEVLDTHWYTSGSPRCRETLRGDLLVGAEYFDPANELESRIEGGEGVRIMRDAEGNLVSEDRIQKGLMAQRTTFYPSGEPKSIAAYISGRQHGQTHRYLPGGVPDAIESWVSGEQHGQTIVFVNGEKKAEVPYEHGRKHGIERRYGPSGGLVEEITWLRDTRHGPDHFLVDGAETVDWYHHGQAVSEAVFARLNPHPH